MSADFPAKLQFLFKPYRYKVLYGGRGGAKSWGVARALLIIGASKPIRVLCAREIQKSIADSVHKLLSDQVASLGLTSFYEVQQTIIKGRNGTEFTFHGLKHNIGNIKSVEGTDVAWIEEAQTVSKSSWDTLIPTIRKDGSEIWITFNPELEEDETYKRFVKNPPSSAIVVKLNWSDNPWFPDVLRSEKDDLKARDPDAYLNVWEGHCRLTLDGAVYANELRKATEDGRLTRVPYNPIKPVHTVWDLGWADCVSIWFVQMIGFEHHVIDFLQDSQKTINHYLGELQRRGYVYDTDWLPHDAQNKTLAAGGKSIEEIMKAAGRKVRIVPKLSIADGINAARTIFSNCYFDAEKCADGIQCLRHYRYDVDKDTGAFSKMPLHDANSHAADAFRYFAVGVQERQPRKQKSIEHAYGSGGGWMGA